jgi:hypothetical protein
MEIGTHKDRVTAAFKELRKRGYTCRQSFTCCGSCGSYELAEMVTARGGDPDTAKVVWYHQQDAEAFDRPTGKLTRNLMLRWNGDAAEIKQVLEAQGLMVIHNGSSERCIEVACFDGFTYRVARKVVQDLRDRGWTLKGQNPDQDDALNTVAERLVIAGVSDPGNRSGQLGRR